ncbi:MAG: hypothetical protein WCA30_06035 [Dermatophilaceae bacterium]
MRVTMVVPAAVAIALTVVGCGSGDGSPSSPSSQGVLADTTGDSPFYLENVSVRVAESFPVQLFLDVSGNAPTPCHSVAYVVQKDEVGIAVSITSQSSTQACAQVLDPRQLVIPLGPSELPVTVTVNDDEYVETVRP